MIIHHVVSIVYPPWFCVKLCRYQHLEVSGKLPTDAWFPCTAQFDTNELEQSFWLKVHVCVCVCVHISVFASLE